MWHTLKELRKFPETLKFLLAYFLYNDGIQTVLAVAAVFAAAPVARGGVGIDQETLTLVILVIQFVAFFGALLWGRLAERIGAKQSLLWSLIIWSAVVTYAYFGLKGPSRVAEFWVLSMFIALVMGGSQAISRSLYAQLIPDGKEAEFYAFYEVSERGTSWIGPAFFGFVNQVFHNLRPAVFSLIIFFLLGLLLLPRVDVARGMAQAMAYSEPAEAVA